MTPDSPLARRVVPSPNRGDRRGRTIDALVLHYTGMPTGEAALARLRDPLAEVSCHYLVWEDGRIDQLVAEADRAWHAGRSFWRGERDVNAVSLGVEIVNPGHDGGCPPYPARQIDAVIALGLDVCRRHAITPARVLAHSDIAPDRKIDPGEWFPWDRLAAAGLGLRVAPPPARDEATLALGDFAIDDLVLGDLGEPVAALQVDLAALGFEVAVTATFCPVTASAVAALQRHHRPARVDGRADAETRAILRALLRAGDGVYDYDK